MSVQILQNFAESLNIFFVKLSVSENLFYLILRAL